MKKLLLTSAIVAVSGAAFAEITWSGSAELGYRTHNVDAGLAREINDSNYEDASRIYLDGDLNVKATAELDNGITVSLDYGFDLDYNSESFPYDFGNSDGIDLAEFPTLTIESSVGKLVAGDVDHAANDYFDDVDGMSVGFTEAEDEFVLRADTNFAGVDAGFSTTIQNPDDYEDGSDFGALGLSQGSLTFGLSGEVNGILFTAGYERNEGKVNGGWADVDLDGKVDLWDDNNDNDIVDAGETEVADVMNFTGVKIDWAGNTIDPSTTWGIGGGYTWNGIKVLLAYAQTDATSYRDLDGSGTTTAGDQVYEGAQSVGIELGYTLEQYGLDVTLGVAQNTWQGDDFFGHDDYEFTGWSIETAFDFAGADVTLGYEDENTDVSGAYNEGFYMDASYAVTPELKILAGFDETEKPVFAEDLADKKAGMYAGVEYMLADNTTVFATWSNADEMGDPEYNAGSTVGIKVTF